MSATSLLNIQTAISYLSGAGQSGRVTLGSVTFSGMEVPNALRVGGQQTLIVHKLPGGDRIIDSGGNDPDRLMLAGRFTGSTALARAQAVEAMRKKGAAITFSAIGLSWTVKIRAYWYNYTLKGAVIPYEIELEVQADATTTASTSTKALAGLIGDDTTAALTGITTAISDVSSLTSSITSSVSSVIGQVTPIANIIGVGGPLATAQNYLTSVQTTAAATQNLASLPSSLSSTISDLTTAGTNIGKAVTQTGANIEGISLSNGVGLTAALENAQTLTASVDSGALVNRSLVNARSAANAEQTGPVVHG